MTGGEREPEVALVLSAEAWVDALHRHCADHGGARVRCLVLDPAVALDEEFDVLVAGERWPALTRPFVDALHDRGRRVLVVGDPEAGADLAARIGVDRIVAVTSDPTRLVEAIVALVPTPPERSTATAPLRATHPAAAAGSSAGRSSAGPVVAVGGPRGSGATEIALALAGALVRGHPRPVVVDADPLTPSVAVRLGLPLEPNLCTAVDAVAFGLGAVPGALFDLGDDWPVVLVGAPNRRAGAALTGADVVAVLRVLAQRFAPVVVDVSAGDGVDPDGGDVRAAVTAAADAIVAIGTATPVGLVRLVEWLDDTTSSATLVHVVVNRAPAARARRAEITRDLQRGGRFAGVHFVPSDARLEERAWDASLADRGPFARAIDQLARVLAGELEAVDGSATTTTFDERTAGVA